MTERLYYSDPYLTLFDANVVETVPLPGGRSAVRLDRTAFYPTSGGQPHDTGELGTARVIEVIDVEDGAILHVVDAPLRDGPVKAQIDWVRRFDHMQQHTGQHVLSAAFDRVAGAPTVSFHLGVESATIDLAREVSPQDVARAEDEANGIVWGNRSVSIRYADAEEAATLPLRKESARKGRLRLIEVDGFDLSACGGTHVARTGEIGIVAVASTERFRGGTRVEFLCGRRALVSHRRQRDLVAAGVRVLSVAPVELPAAIERLQADAKELRRQARDFQARLVSHEAEALVGRAEPIGGVPFVLASFDGWDPAGLKQLASAIAARPGIAAFLISTPAPSAIVVARSEGVPVDSAALLKRVVSRFGGKGGGRPELAQGGGLDGGADEILAFARTAASIP